MLTAEHLQRAIASLPGGGGPGGPGDGGLTKEDLEATMKQMLMVREGPPRLLQQAQQLQQQCWCGVSVSS